MLSGLQEWACSTHAILAMLITDIVSSTEKGIRHGDKIWLETYKLQHAQRVAELISEHDCRQVKDNDDGFTIVFRTAVEALRFAMKLHTDTGHPEIKIRESIHVGALRIEPHDVQGLTYNLTSRINGWKRSLGFCQVI